MLIYAGLIPESISELKTAAITQSGVRLRVPDESSPGDSGYFSRTDSYSQSDYCDDMESDSEAEKVSESGRIKMQPLDHCETDRPLLTDSSVTTNSKKLTGFSKLGPKDTRTTILH